MESHVKGSYRQGFPFSDLRIGDYVHINRIEGWIKIDTLNKDGSVSGPNQFGSRNTVTTSAGRVFAWVAHR